jgi:hypothetical protein
MANKSEKQPRAVTADPFERVPVVCGAKTKDETPCQNPPEEGKRRCRLHGGAKGSGAPTGNKNALKHGFYTAEAIAKRRAARRLVKESRQLMSQLFAVWGRI